MTTAPPPDPHPPEEPPPAAEPPGPPGPIERSTDPVRLVVHAVGQLPPEQRDLVLTWLLRQRPGLSRWTIGARATEHAAELHALQLTAASQLGRGVSSAAQQQVVPVRFPAEQHAQLRQWCTEHGFSMATVIRGLVARFLERQLPDQN